MDIAVNPEVVITEFVVNKMNMFPLIHLRLPHTLIVHHQMLVLSAHARADRLVKPEIVMVMVKFAAGRRQLLVQHLQI